MGCGLKVRNLGFYRNACLPPGVTNPPRKDKLDTSKNRLVVRTAAAVADLEYPALTTQQMEDATAKALLSFNKKHLQVGKLNSLPAMGAHERPLFEKLLWGLVSSTIFVRC